MALKLKNNPHFTPPCFQKQTGVVLLVMLTILILGSSYMLVSKLNIRAQHDKQLRLTLMQLNRVTQAMLGYAVANGRLPCPDTNNNGFQNGPGCNAVEGGVPWLDLGIANNDAWGRALRYRADDNFTAATQPGTNSTSGLLIETLAGAVLSQTNPNAPVAIIFSCGPDGVPNDDNDANGVTNNNSNCLNPGTANTTYIKDSMQTNFDDLVVFIPKALLQSRMTRTGNWP